MLEAQHTKPAWFYRGFFYVFGLLVLALGITMNTKAGLGVSPIISVSYSISTIWKFNFGNITLLLYSSYILVEMLLHVIQNHKQKKTGSPQRKLLLVLLLDILQFPLSLVFTRFLNLFSGCIPDLSSAFVGTFWHSIPGRILFLAVAIVLTGIGAALSLNMRIIPNPGDGIVQAIADSAGRSVGLSKNCFDLLNVCITITVSLLATGHLVGVGLGTVLCVIGVGRVIALFNYLCFTKTAALAGLNKAVTAS